jgi:hypothetical protein
LWAWAADGRLGGEARPRTAYHRLVRSFDHSDLAALPGYPALRQALGGLMHQVQSDDADKASEAP